MDIGDTEWGGVQSTEDGDVAYWGTDGDGNRKKICCNNKLCEPHVKRAWTRQLEAKGPSG